MVIVPGKSHGAMIIKGGSAMRSMQTLTRADLAEAINRKVGLSRSDSLGMVEAILDHMGHALEKGENVKVSGFGTFLLRDKAQRVGRNPKTGVEVPITPRRVLTFRASQMLKDRIAKG
jgi:integration host factor subunit alpha